MELGIDADDNLVESFRRQKTFATHTSCHWRGMKKRYKKPSDSIDVLKA